MGTSRMRYPGPLGNMGRIEQRQVLGLELIGIPQPQRAGTAIALGRRQLEPAQQLFPQARRLSLHFQPHR